MTAVHHVQLVCDVCGTQLHEHVQQLGNQPLQELLPSMQQPPVRFVYQYLGRVYDFCDECAKPIAAGVERALEIARAKAALATTEGEPKQ